MNFLDEVIQQAQQAAVDGVSELVEREVIKERMKEEAQEYAQAVADHINDPDGCPEPTRFPPVPIDENGRLEYYLVLDFLESIGLKFAPTVFRYESQHPNFVTDRDEVAATLHLRSYDRTPLLVQMIEEKRKSLGKSD
jgi:hypothetical protein